MIAAWMVHGLVVGALLAATAFGLEGACRAARRPVRWCWAMALVLTAVLIGRAPLLDPISLAPADSIAHATGSGPVSSTSTSAMALSRVSKLLVVVGESVQAPVAAAGRAVPASAAPWLAAGWVGASVVLFFLMWGVDRRFRRARSAWPIATLHGVRVRIAPDLGPAVLGLRPPEIVVPRWLMTRAAHEQRLVLSHERQHVTAKDPLLLAAGWAAVALMPWNPAVWWMFSRLRLAVELDCDSRVLHDGAAPDSYGGLLIELATQNTGIRTGIAMADRSSHLRRRLIAMSSRLPRFARTRAGILSGAALLLVVIACESRLPTETELARPDYELVNEPAALVVDERPIWSPDGAMIDFKNYVVDAERLVGELRELTLKMADVRRMLDEIEVGADTGFATIIAGKATWSPDGHRLQGKIIESARTPIRLDQRGRSLTSSNWIFPTSKFSEKEK
jgi:bla regulator protein BlaR1